MLRVISFTNIIMIILFIEQFNQLIATLPSIRSSSIRSIQVAVAVFLAKLLLGLSNRILATLFRLDNGVVSHVISQVRKALINDFVPYYLGLQHINRETAIVDKQKLPVFFIVINLTN